MTYDDILLVEVDPNISMNGKRIHPFLLTNHKTTLTRKYVRELKRIAGGQTLVGTSSADCDASQPNAIAEGGLEFR
jgi:hypothetical protein